MQPKVTVFVPLYNNEKYIDKTLNSVLSQTYQDFEILVINDGSTDTSVEIVKSYKDPRIRILHNEKNSGLVYTRNRGLDEVRTEYMAIIDSDDIWYREKLEQQVQFLDAHPDFAMVGTWTELIDSYGVKTGVAWKNNFLAERIPILLLFHNCFTQSSIIIRIKSLAGKRYRSPDTDEDYDLWMQLSKEWGVWNIPKVLTQYRVHEASITKKPITKTFVDTELRKELGLFGLDPTPEEFAVHKCSYGYRGNNPKQFILMREKWLQKFKGANSISNRFPEKGFAETMNERWLTSCSANARLGFWTWKTFWSSPLSKNALKDNPKMVIKFFIKCLLKK